MKKIVILDRDGVINHDSMHYIKSVDEFVPIEGSFEAMARLTAAGYAIGIATNQSGVARGLYTEETLLAIHAKMRHMAESFGAHIAAIDYCLHLPDSGCSWRKPAPGMLLSLGKKMGVDDLAGVPFVGDRVSDIQAAQAAGAEPFMILSQMTDREGLKSYMQVPVFSSLNAWVDFWLQTH